VHGQPYFDRVANGSFVLLRGVEACRIRHVSRLLTGTRAEDVTYQSQTACSSLRLPCFVSPSSLSELAYGPCRASFRKTVHTDVSSAFFLHLLTPINFISFLTQYDHPNFGLPASLLPFGFPRNNFLTVLSSDALTTRILKHSGSRTEFKRQPVCCRDNSAVGKVKKERGRTSEDKRFDSGRGKRFAFSPNLPHCLRTYLCLLFNEHKATFLGDKAKGA
jgi:hypothetical protein